MGLFQKVNCLINNDFVGLLSKAKGFNIQNPLYKNNNFLNKLEKKYYGYKAVLLINRKNSFSLVSSFSIDENTKQKIFSSKDFWNGTFSITNTLVKIQMKDLLPYRQLFSQNDNQYIHNLFLERYYINGNEYINLLMSSNFYDLDYDKIQRLNNDIKFLLMYHVR